MRREKVIKINGKSVTVRELRTADVIGLIESANQDGIQTLVGVQAGMPSDVKKLMAMGVDVSAEEFEELVEGISGFTAIESVFREVNADFFASLPQRVRSLLDAAEAMGSQLKHFSKSAAYSSKKAT